MSDKPDGETSRVGVYIDGYNLYYALRELSGRRDLWLDLAGMARALLREGQSLQGVTYFTAPIRGDDPEAVARQRRYLRALECGGDVRIVLGRFQEQRRRCRQCGAVWRAYAEKKTDVAIASAMVADVACGLVDVVMLVSADSDLCAAVERLRVVDEAQGSRTRVVTVFPPGRSADGLRRCSDAWFPLGHAVIRRSQLPDVVPGRDGAVYHRPPYWC